MSDGDMPGIDEIAAKLKAAGYHEAFSKEVGKKMWQVHLKPDNATTRVAFLNDASEFMTTKVLSREDKDEERYSIESVIETYPRFDTAAQRTRKNYKWIWVWMLIGAAAFAAITEGRPRPAIVGALAGAVSFYLHKLGRIYDIKREKQQYVKEHSILTGGDAIGRL